MTYHPNTARQSATPTDSRASRQTHTGCDRGLIANNTIVGNLDEIIDYHVVAQHSML
jgi:hypothetical protein